MNSEAAVSQENNSRRKVFFNTKSRVKSHVIPIEKSRVPELKKIFNYVTSKHIQNTNSNLSSVAQTLCYIQ